MMRLTESEFLERNNELQFFDKDSAKDFYRLMATRNTTPAVLILIGRLEKLGWYTLNKNLGLLSSWEGIDYIFIEDLLSFRLDDFILTIDKIDGLQDIYGNYLLTDFITYDSTLDTISLKKEQFLLQRLAYKAATKKEIFLKNIVDDVLVNVNSRDISFLVRLVVYNTFLEKCTTSEESNYAHTIVENVLANKRIYLVSMIKYMELHLSEDNVLLSRMNLLKVRNDYSYQFLINNLRSQTLLSSLIDMLDIIETT